MRKPCVPANDSDAGGDTTTKRSTEQARPPEVWLPNWRDQVDRQGRALNDATVADAALLCQEPRAIARNIVFPAGCLPDMEQGCGKARSLIGIAGRSRARRCRSARTARSGGCILVPSQNPENGIPSVKKGGVGAPGQAPVAARDLPQSVIPRYSGDSFKTSPPVA